MGKLNFRNFILLVKFSKKFDARENMFYNGLCTVFVHCHLSTVCK